MIMFCVYCGAQLPDGAAFCSRCGKAQPGQSAVKQEIKNLSDRFLGTDGLLNKTFQAAKKGMREAAKQGQELYKQINSLQEGTDEEVNYISVTFPDPPSPEDCARYPGVTNLKPVTFRNRNNGSLQALSYPSMGINPGWWYQINGEILSGMGPAEKAVPYFEEGASFLNRNCMVWMGSLYGGGIGVQTNVFVAKEWYEKAASLGSNLAKLRLGRLYYDRLPVEYRDPELAVQLMEEAISKRDQTEDTSPYVVHDMIRPMIFEDNWEMDKMFLEQTAEWAIDLAFCYSMPYGTEVNIEKALQYRMLYEQYGSGEKNFIYKAVCAFQSPDKPTPLPPEQRIGKARQELENGDYYQALIALNPLAHEGNAEAMRILITLYRDGINGVTNPQRAAFWQRRLEQTEQEGNAGNSMPDRSITFESWI